MININKEKKTIKQFVKLCRIALKYEKVNYYSERKRMAERESHIEMFSEKQLEMIDKVFDTYHADYFQIMGYEIGIVDGDLAQALREMVLCQEKVQVKSELFLQPSIFYPANLSILFNFCSYSFSYSFGDRYPQ